MKFRVLPEIFDSFPGLEIGSVVAKGINNRGPCPEIVHLIKKTQEQIKAHFRRENLMDHPKFQSWREAFVSFGAKPKKHRSSVENLYRLIADGKDLRSINKIVDIYNYISLKYMVPVGGDDLAKVEGDIVLRFAEGDEVFTPLGSDEIQKARKGEVIYADQSEVLCRRWNWRESEKTKMTEQSQDILLIAEGLPPVGRVEMEGFVHDLSQLIEKYCGGGINSAVLCAEEREFDLQYILAT
jgi:DNA/RNA-binding domain of Phe-tRNA-synthetase-like protein